MTTDTNTLLDQLLTTALRLTVTDTDHAAQHQRIADSLTRYGRRHFGPRFGDDQHKPQTSAGCLDNDILLGDNE